MVRNQIQMIVQNTKYGPSTFLINPFFRIHHFPAPASLTFFFYIIVDVSGEAVIRTPATFRDASTFGRAPPPHKLQFDDVPCNQEFETVSFGLLAVRRQLMAFSLSYHSTTRNYVPETLGDFYTSGFYARESRKMRTVSRLASSRLPSFVGLHIPEMIVVENRGKGVVEVFTDDETIGKEIHSCLFNLH